MGAWHGVHSPAGAAPARPPSLQDLHLGNSLPTAEPEVPRTSGASGTPSATYSPAQLAAKATLGRWLGWRMVLVMGVASAVVVVLAHLALNRMFDAYERSAASDDWARVQAVVLRDSQTLGEFTQDYAFWDDSYAFVNSAEGSYMDDNFSLSSLRNLRVLGAVVLGVQGQVLGVRRVHEGELLNVLPAELASVLTGSSVLATCQARSSQLIWLDGEPLMVAKVPTRNTQATAPPMGCLLFMRALDAAYFESVREFTGVAASLRDGTNTETRQWASTPDHWMAQGAVPELSATLTVTHDSSLTTERTWIVALVAGALALVTALAVGVLYGLFQYKVVGRIARLSALTERYRAQPLQPLGWPEGEDDEIQRLGRSFNELVAQVQRQARHAFTHDALTGLLNRQGLDEQLQSLPFSKVEQRSLVPCLVLLDLDNFKVLNDGFGHAVGDALLRHVAQQLSQTVRSGDAVARVSGDEFAVVLLGIPREHSLDMARRLLECVRVPLVHNDLQVATSASMGLAYADTASSAANLVRNADLAMYQAKQSGRDSWCLFNEALQVSAQRRSRLTQALRQAVQDDSLQVAYQPVVDVATRRVLGVEALARWSLDGEAISPAEFIPIAEETGLIGKLGMQVLHRSCALLARLRAQGHPLYCSVNLSLRQFLEFDLVHDVPKVVSFYGLPAAAIRLEITESLVAESETPVTNTMRALHALGFDFQLDDFGTGQSSLHRLQTLPFQTLKIDRSFVIPLDRGDTLMVRTVLDLAHALGQSVVAEGVETTQQLAALQALGVSRIQGFLLARPMSDLALEAWLAQPLVLPISDGAPDAAGQSLS